MTPAERFATCRVARLATAGPDGLPHLVPIVFALVGDVLHTAVDGKPKRTRRLKNPTYQGPTPAFWRRCDAICGEKSWVMHGVAPDLKGRPLQVFTAGHGTAPARFLDVEIGAHELMPKLYADGDPIPRVDHPDAHLLTKRRSSSISLAQPVSENEDEDEEEEDIGEAATSPPVVLKKKTKKKKRAIRGARKRNRK